MRGGITRRTCALLLAVVGVISALVAVGCGGSDGTRDRPDRSATLVLDFRRNAVHAGIELAVARDFDGAEGVPLRVREPPSSADAVGQLVSGRAQLAVVDVHDLALARAAGHDVVGVMAVVQRPLA